MGGHTLMKLFLCLSTWEMNTGHTDMGPQLQLACGGSGVWEGLSFTVSHLGAVRRWLGCTHPKAQQDMTSEVDTACLGVQLGP